MDLYFFDFDKTLHTYDFRKRLPALSRLTGASQYRLAKTWWAGGYERRAEAGEWPTSAEYLAKFAEVTGAALTLQQWQQAREAASAPIPGSVDALRLASTHGEVSLLSNNPAPFRESLPEMAPEIVEIVGDNQLVSFQLGLRKPDPEFYRRALAWYGTDAADTFFVDDSAANVASAASVGLTAHQLAYVDGVPQTDALHEAITRFAHRND